MDLRHMRQFVAVAEELHFGRAAIRLDMAQPPLSQSIKRLEADLEVRLFDRSRRGVWLTEPGKVLLEEARRTLLQAELARAVTRRAAATESARISVSFIGPALFRLIPPLLIEHYATDPMVEIKLFERSSPLQMEGILQGAFEIGFVHPSVDLIEGGDKLLVERCRYIAAIPSSWPIAQAKSVKLSELAPLPAIMAPASEAPSRVAEMLAAFRSIGVMPNVAQEAMQTHTRLSLVGAALGYGIIPGSAALVGRKDVAFVPIEDLPETLKWELSMVWWPQHMSAPARRFVERVTLHIAAHPELLDIDAPIKG